MKHVMYVFLNYDSLTNDYFNMYKSVIQDMKSVKIIKEKWVSGKAWSYYMYVIEIDNPDIAAFLYRLNSCYEVIITDAERLDNVKNELCRKAVGEELNKLKHIDLAKL